MFKEKTYLRFRAAFSAVLLSLIRTNPATFGIWNAWVTNNTYFSGREEIRVQKKSASLGQSMWEFALYCLTHTGAKYKQHLKFAPSI